MSKFSRRSFKNKKAAQRPRSKPSDHKFHPKSKKAAPAGPTVFAEGILQHKGSFGFVLSEDPAVGDVLIQGQSLRLAMAGDRVLARVTSSPTENRRSGCIVEVLNHARKTVVGTFKRMGNQNFVTMENDEGQVRILDMKEFSPKVGEIVVVAITRWPSQEGDAAGTLTEVLGSRDTPGVDLQAVVRHHNLPDTFSQSAEAEAGAFGMEVPESKWNVPNRESFINERVFTIDGADAKDFDDAVSIQQTSDGWQLGVHIADVAEYVKEGSFLDAEAFERGTSVYLSGRVIPMLPFALSDNLCSLRPQSIRLTLSCIMDINRDGQIVKHRVVESVIKSVKRFTYEEVEDIIRGQNPQNLSEDIIQDVRKMDELARFLRKKRFARGSLDFDFPEPQVITELNGRPKDIRKRERLESHKLIEDFMLLANETVARHMQLQPFIYRIHETPDPLRLEKLKKSLDTLGVSVPVHANIRNPKVLSSILTAVEKTPTIQPMVHLLILRSLKQAVYSNINKGHFGLASTCYTHFTSPIRRYPDLIVHRLVKERIQGIRRPEHWAEELPQIADHCSKRERIAVDAEREFLDIQKVRLMEPHIGQTFTGVISSVTNFGFFVQLDPFFVEGLVHVTNLDRDYYYFDEARMILVGRRTGQTFRMGLKVKIRLSAANILKHQLDFDLVSAEPRKAPAPQTQSNRPMEYRGRFRKFFKQKRQHKH